MLDLGNPYTKHEIMDAVVGEQTAVSQFFTNIPDDVFYTAPANVWTPADNLVHLIKSASPVVMALNLPKRGIAHTASSAGDALFHTLPQYASRQRCATPAQLARE